MTFPRTFAIAFLSYLATAPLPVFAADAAFVGILATAIEDDVSKELGMSEVTKKKLLEIVDARETEALNLALELKDLPQEERAAKLAPFVAESEKQGFALLTVAQQAKLAQVAIAREGLVSLAREAINKKVGLSDVQSAEVSALVAELQQKQRSATESQRRLAKAETERQLAKVLTKEQRAAWDQLAGLATVAEAAPAAEVVKPMPPGEKGKPEATKTVVTTKEVEKKPVGPPKVPKNLEDVRLKFSFQFTPWRDVIEWFASQSDLSVVGKNIPAGTFNYTDSRSYTPAQAIDLINGVLQTEGFMLLRRDRMLFVINLEDGIPPTLLTEVSEVDLDKRGEYEVVSVLFTLKQHSPEEVEKDIRQMLGPLGAMKVLTKSKQIYVTETAGKLKTIRSIIQALEGTADKKNEGVEAFKLTNITPDELMGIARPLMGLPENVNMVPDGSLRIALDGLNKRILVTGKTETVEKFRDLVAKLDVPGTATDIGPTAIDTPQLKIYQITTADPDVALQVLQTLLAGKSDVRLTRDAKTGNIVAYAPVSVHATIREVLDQMQKDARPIEVFKLKKVDPETAVAAINKLFAVGEGPSTAAPKVEADTTLMAILVRGSQSQIEQIRELLVKMGENGVGGKEDLTPIQRTNVRTIPVTGRAADNALKQIELMWPVIHGNKVRINRLTPSNSDVNVRDFRVKVPETRTPTRRTETSKPSEAKPGDEESSTKDESSRDDRRRREDRGDDREEKNPEEVVPREDRSSSWQRTRFYFVDAEPAEGVEQEGTGSEKLDSEEAKSPDESSIKPVTEEPAIPRIDSGEPKSVPGADVVITIGPGGIVIASEDLDALDELEKMLADAASTPPGKELTIFYLRFAKADAAVELLQQTLSGSSGSSDSDGGGSLMGDLASSMMGNMGGGLLGSLMGGGGGGGGGFTSSGPVAMVADTRLNAIIAQGKPADLELVEQLLKVVDQESSPEDVQVIAKPRFISVVNVDATEMASVVKQVYSGRIQADASQPRQPSPEDFIRALRGGRGGGGGARGGDRQSAEQKMTLGVDVKSNSLIVSAPEPLFQEVKKMVEQLDIAGGNKDESVSVVRLKGTNPALVEKALNSMVGNVTVNRQMVTSSQGNPQQQRRPNGQQSPSGAGNNPQNPAAAFQPPQMQDEIRRRIEAFNQGQRGAGGQQGGRGAGGGRGR